MSFFKRFSTFHKLVFLIYTTLYIVIFLIPLFRKGGVEKNLTLMGAVALISTLTGLLSSIYTARGQAICYIWGVVNTFTYIFVAWSSQAYGQSILYIFFETPMQIIGYYLWRKNMKESAKETVEVKKLQGKEWIFLIILFAIVWIGYGVFLNFLPEMLKNLFNIVIAPDKQFLIDSLSSTLTITAVILTSKRYFEQWHFWIASSAIGSLLFIVSMIQAGHFDLNSFSALAMWSEFFIGSVYGFILWKKLNKEQHMVEELEEQQQLTV